MAGGSMADIPAIENPAFYTDAATMKPVVSVNRKQGLFMLANTKGEKIVYCSGRNLPEIEWPESDKEYLIIWIDPANGQILETEKIVKGEKKYKLNQAVKEDIVLWIKLH